MLRPRNEEYMRLFETGEMSIRYLGCLLDFLPCCDICHLRFLAKIPLKMLWSRLQGGAAPVSQGSTRTPRVFVNLLGLFLFISYFSIFACRIYKLDCSYLITACDTLWAVARMDLASFPFLNWLSSTRPPTRVPARDCGSRIVDIKDCGSRTLEQGFWNKGLRSKDCGTRILEHGLRVKDCG